MEYMKFDSINESDSNYSFPSEFIVNRNQLIAHVRKSYMSKRKIISVRLERTVKKGQESDGRIFELRDEDTRKGAMRKYTPTGTTNRCYCQMCKKLMSNDLIEVNNLELDPEYYIPEFRVALCLNCSVHFKSLRANRYKRQIYFKNIQNAVIQNQGNITIQVDTNTTITFTDTHLAEIQEILKHMPD